MKTFNELNEHHDADWPSELLSMSLDELLDKLKKVDQTAYEEVESILKRRVGDLIGTWATDEEGDEVSSFDEMMLKDTGVKRSEAAMEIDELKAALKRTNNPETERLLRAKIKELESNDSSFGLDFGF